MFFWGLRPKFSKSVVWVLFDLFVSLKLIYRGFMNTQSTRVEEDLTVPAHLMPVVSIVMGSRSDLPVMKAAATVLRELEIQYEIRVLSAHRTPDLTIAYAAEAQENGIKVIIAGAGGAAHLPGVIAAKTALPVLGVPVAATPLAGFDALLAIAQMPGGVPVATMAVGQAGAKNAGLYAARILQLDDDLLKQRLGRWIDAQSDKIAGNIVVSDAELEGI
jgi:5-(carboxyamino)imidazole ribonucleotide mutase